MRVGCHNTYTQRTSLKGIVIKDMGEQWDHERGELTAERMKQCLCTRTQRNQPCIIGIISVPPVAALGSLDFLSRRGKLAHQDRPKDKPPGLLGGMCQ
jgi:hypothetical protein